MEAVCCCVRKQVTSLSLFFLAPLRVSPSLSPFFFISHLYLALCLSLTLSLHLFLSHFCSLHADILDWVRQSHGLRSLTRIQCLHKCVCTSVRVCVCVCVCVCVWVCVWVCVRAYVSPSIDEIWAVKYECWVMFRCHVVTSLTRGGVVKMVMHTWRWLSVFDK